MNCKPGDLARVVRRSAHYGKIVRVVKPFDSTTWVVDPPLQIIDDPQYGDGGFYLGVYDSSLRPIANPGEGERDERDILVKPSVTA
jgi:hypothetical protein